MKRIILESPYAGDVCRNIKYAKECMLNSLGRGEAPIASHLLYTQMLNYDISFERELRIRAGLAWTECADLHVFYIDFGYSSGMLEALRYAIDRGFNVEERKIYE